MKELTRIKLINWHYFTHETIEVKGSALFTGDNGSGKSTILDAIQYVLVANLNRIKFNVSAHAETKRTIMGYLRCKTGSDNSENGQTFLRRGDITSVVALEFYDSNKKKYFILGVAADTRESDASPDSKFFKIEDMRLEDKLFTDGRKVFSARSLKSQWGNLKYEVYPTVEAYQKDLLQKLGHLGERFFPLFVKAISFTPIVDLRKFVYDYVLEEKKINLEAMQENFRRYREYSVLAQTTRVKLEQLERILAKGDQLQAEREKIAVQDYIILRGYWEESRSNLADLEQSIRDTKAGMERAEERKLEAQGEKTQAENDAKEIQASLNRDENFQAYQALNRRLAEARDKQEVLAREGGMVRRMSIAEAEALARVLDWEEIGPEERDDLIECKDLLLSLAEGHGPKDESLGFSVLGKGLDALKTLETQWRQKSYELNLRLRDLTDEKKRLYQEIDSLRQRKHVYRPEVTALKQLLSQKLAQSNPQVLCELLEVPDPKWQDAVEGYLNTQRFDLIVGPEYFDAALSLYEKYKREKGIHGVGLVNTGRMQEFAGKTEPNSLAAEVETADPYARGYVNLLLGRVMKCGTEQELKQHRRAITPTCMTYGNHTARQIDFKVYEVPFIGQRAYTRQIELKERRVLAIEQELAGLTGLMTEVDERLSLITGKEKGYYFIQEHLAVFGRQQALASEIAEITRAMESIDSSAIDAIKAELERVEARARQKETEILSLSEKIGALKTTLQEQETRWTGLKAQVANREAELERFITSNPEAANRGEQRYPAEVRQKPPGQLARDFEANRKTLESRVNNLRDALRQVLFDYTTQFHFGGGIDPDDLRDYREEKDKLAGSELPEYEERINRAKDDAEREFKESFVYKLKENIDLARGEFKKLNSALSGVQFGQDRYVFQVMPAEEYKPFYDMVMDTEQLAAGGSLFDGMFHDKHQAAMDELFDRILTEDSDKVRDNLELFTDYRTFLEYDIKMHHANGETSTYSKVCREKSGGETQTPYYVAIVASFMQLYRVQSNNDSMRLMMFDEAFNRMDGERIEASLKFIRQCGMQAVIAAPSEKCEVIAPHVGTTVVVMRDGNDSWLHDYHYIKRMEEMFEAEQKAEAETPEAEAKPGEPAAK